MDMPFIHSCSQLTVLNDKLITRMKKLKKRNGSLEKELSSINERLKIEKLLREHSLVRHVGVQTDPFPRGSLRVIKQPQSHDNIREENKKTVDSLLKNHRNLVKRYDREVKLNTNHIKTIASLNLRIQELEQELSAANERVRLHEYQSQRHTPHRWSTPRDESSVAYSPRQTGRRRHHSRQSYSPQHNSSGILSEVDALRQERDKLAKEKKKMKKELGMLDENFFEEIEDLKYALQQSARLNQEYDKALRQKCEEFGAPFPLDSVPSRPKHTSSSGSKRTSSRTRKK